MRAKQCSRCRKVSVTKSGSDLVYAVGTRYNHQGAKRSRIAYRAFLCREHFQTECLDRGFIGRSYPMTDLRVISWDSPLVFRNGLERLCVK